MIGFINGCFLVFLVAFSLVVCVTVFGFVCFFALRICVYYWFDCCFWIWCFDVFGLFRGIDLLAYFYLLLMLVVSFDIFRWLILLCLVCCLLVFILLLLVFVNLLVALVVLFSIFGFRCLVDCDLTSFVCIVLYWI